VVHVKGFVGSWKDRKKIDVNEGKGAINPTDDFDLTDFLPETKKDVEEMYSQVLELVDSVEHEGYKKLLETFFRDEEFARAFKRAPGAMFYHHAWLGGLLEHSLAVARVALEAAKGYETNHDLIVTGALLHDIGKMKEFEVSTSIKVGEEGMLRGHVVIGEEMMREKARSIGLEGRDLLKLSHLILAHHGKEEFGSPKPPMFVEAMLVYYADELDSKASQFARIKSETNTEDFRVYDRHWGQVYLK
jgi:3'-5' exoribonuclease